MKTYHVYMLFCRDGTYYIGVTNDLNRRIAEHEQGLDEKSYTFSRRPIALVWSTQYTDILQAIACEKQLKGWSHRKKRVLTEGRFLTAPSRNAKTRTRGGDGSA